MPDVSHHRAAFRALHESGCFAIPNPWDPGTARVLRQLGFHALATTSGRLQLLARLSRFADALSVDAVLSHIAATFAELNTMFAL